MNLHLHPKHFFLSLLSLYLMAGCIKNNISGSNSNSAVPPQQPQATSIGTTTGDQVSQVIGPGGGSIVSSDSSAELVVPAGALSSNTTITMQPITNNCPGGYSSGFRFGPDGLHFSQPATLKFRYTTDILSGTLGELMGIGYQDTSGYWHRVKQITNDTVQKIITASVKHFTDYVPFTLLTINPAAATLRPGNVLELQVQVANSDDDDLPQLPGTTTPDIQADPYIIVYNEGKCNWEINGGQHTADFGQFITDNGILVIDYEAPNFVPQTGDVVAVSATIDMGGMVLNGKKYNKTILVSNIKISESLVFSIDIEMNSNDGDFPSPGTFNVAYTDGVTFTVTLTYDPTQGVDVASFSAFNNRPPTVAPTSYHTGDAVVNSTYTWIPDQYGEINIVSGSGQGTVSPLGEEIMLSFTHQNTTVPMWQTVACAYGSCSTFTDVPSGGGLPIGMNFLATNNDTTYVLTKDGQGNNFLTAKIHPQH